MCTLYCGNAASPYPRSGAKSVPSRALPLHWTFAIVMLRWRMPRLYMIFALASACIYRIFSLVLQIIKLRSLGHWTMGIRTLSIHPNSAYRKLCKWWQHSHRLRDMMTTLALLSRPVRFRHRNNALRLILHAPRLFLKRRSYKSNWFRTTWIIKVMIFGFIFSHVGLTCYREAAVVLTRRQTGSFYLG